MAVDREPSPQAVLAVPASIPSRGAFKHVPARIVIGPRGPCVARGYTEIGGLRFYDDQLVVGPHGQYVLRRGETEAIDDDLSQSGWLIGG